MPAHLMYDGKDGNLFGHFSYVVQRLGVYTARNYDNILEFLVKRWNVQKIDGISSKGRKDQAYLCILAPCIRNLDERVQEREKQERTCAFSWIFNEEEFLL